MAETTLIRYDEARRALQVASSVDEAKQIKDQADALHAYARQRNDVDMENWLADIKLRASMRIGELTSKLDKGSGPGRGNKTLPDTGKSFKTDVLRAANISTSAAHRCEVLARHPDIVEQYLAAKAAENKPARLEEVEAYIKKKVKQAGPREYAYDVLREYCAITDLDALAAAVVSGEQEAFGTVLADPPWIYGNQSTRGATGDHYVGLSVDEICAMPIATLSADDSHLHLWTTNAFLYDSFRVMSSWGFTYKSCYVWVKPQIGMGNYWRVSHEFLLLGVKGSLRFADHTLRSWGEFKRSKHSAKPEHIRDLIHKASPVPRLELFARRAVEGWTCWGNEIRKEVFQ